jgi:hypothetical protein
MIILDRDRLIVLSIARFGQLASEHIAAMHFADVKSPTPQWRTMHRLMDHNYVKLVERRPVGGNGSGSGQFVYQLGSAGHALSGRPGKYWPYRSVNLHTLAIADVHVELVRAEQSGRITIDRYDTEPHTHRVVAGAELRPDYYVDAGDKVKRRNVELWIEADRGTERQDAIKDKLKRYAHAYEQGSMTFFPRVVFIAPDEPRARELRTIIERGRVEVKDLFYACTLPEFTGLFFG